MKGYRRYIAIIVVLFGALVLLEYSRPKPVDWSQTLSREDKIPYGTFALYELLPDIFEGEPVQPVREPVYNMLQDSTLSGNYIFINKYFALDSLDTNLLLDFVHRGNEVFIAAESFPLHLSDSLHFEWEMMDSIAPDSTGLLFSSLPQQKAYTYPAYNNLSYLTVTKQKGHEALGRNMAGKLVFMKVPFGEGHFYISSVPLAFTNYQLLTLNQSAYAATALSHLPVQPVYWDEYQNKGRFDEQSMFGVLMRHEQLTWAYYIALFGIALFLLFKSKRTQRIIPVIEPPRNTTLDFVNVIGNLYYNHGNHKDIAEKSISYFLEHLRLHYHVATSTPDDELRERVIAKSGADAETVTNIFNLMHSIRQSNSIGEQTLMLFNNNLEDFYRQTSTRPLAKV